MLVILSHLNSFEVVWHISDTTNTVVDLLCENIHLKQPA